MSLLIAPPPLWISSTGDDDVVVSSATFDFGLCRRFAFDADDDAADRERLTKPPALGDDKRPKEAVTATTGTGSSCSSIISHAEKT